MSEDFGTVSVRRGERTREIEVLRQHYKQHRDGLARMVADAPTEHLASEYQRLIAEIDRGLGKLAELETGAPAAAAATPPPPPHPARRGAEPAGVDPRLTGPGNRPLVTPPANGYDADPPADLPMPADGGAPRSRVAVIVVVALIALALIGWLIWRASDRLPERPVVEETSTAAPVSTAPDTAVEPAPVVSRELTITPRAHDYGTIRKGTRATRQFEVANNSDQPITLLVSRSACRCLFYEHAPVVPPKAKENVTVTVDGARAKAGELREKLTVSAKSNPAISTSIDVTATIR